MYRCEYILIYIILLRTYMLSLLTLKFDSELIFISNTVALFLIFLTLYNLMAFYSVMYNPYSYCNIKTKISLLQYLWFPLKVLTVWSWTCLAWPTKSAQSCLVQPTFQTYYSQLSIVMLSNIICHGHIWPHLTNEES